jgi:hypothetical protein
MAANMTVISASDIRCTDPDGTPVALVELAADPLVVILVRYFGCLPCQAFVRDVDDALARFPDTARVVTVGGSADYQARWLRDTQSVSMPLLLDPDQRVRRLAEIGNLTPRQLLSPKDGTRYLRTMRRGLRPQMITKDTARAPGVAVFGPDLELRWRYEGVRMGDYPSVDEILRHATPA